MEARVACTRHDIADVRLGHDGSSDRVHTLAARTGRDGSVEHRRISTPCRIKTRRREDRGNAIRLQTPRSVIYSQTDIERQVALNLPRVLHVKRLDITTRVIRPAAKVFGIGVEVAYVGVGERIARVNRIE